MCSSVSIDINVMMFFKVRACLELAGMEPYHYPWDASLLSNTSCLPNQAIYGFGCCESSPFSLGLSCCLQDHQLNHPM